VQHWLSVGAQPSEPVQRLLEKTGDWQKFKGLPAPPPLLVAPERADRKATYEAEAQAAAGVESSTPTKSARKKAEPKATAEKAEPKATAEKAEPKAAAEKAEPKAEPKAAAVKTEEQAGADSAEQA
jgi:small subunit ribosomal protein S16